MSDQPMDIIQNIDKEYEDDDDYQPANTAPTHNHRSQTFDPRNMPKVECYYHKGQYIKNFCKAPQCVIPLCPLCVHIHSREHVEEGSYPVFESLEVLLNEVQAAIQDEANKFSNSYNGIQKHINTFEEHADKTIRRLRDIKHRIVEVVEQFFSGIENEIHHKQKKNVINQQRDATHLLRMIKDRWESMNDQLNTLQSDNCLQAIIPYYTTTFHEDNHSYYRKIDEYVNQFPTVNSEVTFDHQKAAELSLYLKSIIMVQHTSIPDFLGVHQLPTTNVKESNKKQVMINSSRMHTSQVRRQSMPTTEKKVSFNPQCVPMANSMVRPFQPPPPPFHMPPPSPMVYSGFIPPYHRF